MSMAFPDRKVEASLVMENVRENVEFTRNFR